MLIRPLPKEYGQLSSFCYNNVFIWQSGNVFVMDNHMSALWGWLQTCDPTKSYNFMHIDRHYDLLDCFDDADLEPLRINPKISYDSYDNLMRGDGQYKLLRWDNYIRAGQVLHPNWFHVNLFLTQNNGDIGTSWGHKPMTIREENPLFMEWYIQQYIGEHEKYLDGFNGDDYKHKWIVNLDLDVFYTCDSNIQLFSDDYIRRIAQVLNDNLSRIEVLTIAISPDCLGGKDMSEKWENGFRILKTMSEQLTCIKELFLEVFK